MELTFDDLKSQAMNWFEESRSALLPATVYGDGSSPAAQMLRDIGERRVVFTTTNPSEGRHRY